MQTTTKKMKTSSLWCTENCSSNGRLLEVCLQHSIWLSTLVCTWELRLEQTATYMSSISFLITESWSTFFATCHHLPLEAPFQVFDIVRLAESCLEWRKKGASWPPFNWKVHDISIDSHEISIKSHDFWTIKDYSEGRRSRSDAAGWLASDGYAQASEQVSSKIHHDSYDYDHNDHYDHNDYDNHYDQTSKWRLAVLLGMP